VTPSYHCIDPLNGTLTPVQWTPTGGRTPRNFAIDPSSRVLVVANQHSHSLVVFRIDSTTGRLEATSEEFEVGMPTYVLFLPLE
jgi:6-phosphogluconolactonase